MKKGVISYEDTKERGVTMTVRDFGNVYEKRVLEGLCHTIEVTQELHRIYSIQFTVEKEVAT